MKKLITKTLGVLLCLCSLHSIAQDQKVPLNETDYNKPKLFNDLPQKMNLRVTELENLFQYQVGSPVNVRITDNFLFEGVVVSTSDAKDISVKTVVIRSTNREGASFTFTRTTSKEGGNTYLGRIISRNNGDAFEILPENGTYVLQKKNLYDLISE